VGDIAIAPSKARFYTNELTLNRPPISASREPLIFCQHPSLYLSGSLSNVPATRTVQCENPTESGIVTGSADSNYKALELQRTKRAMPLQRSDVRFPRGSTQITPHKRLHTGCQIGTFSLCVCLTL
jgi:hypothetical protein